MIYQWCGVHRLNLAIESSIKKEKKVQAVLQILNDFAVLMRESGKRMDEWDRNMQRTFKEYGDINPNKRPVAVTAIRWWSKEKSLRTVINNSSSFLVTYKCAYAMVTSKDLTSRFEETQKKQEKVLTFLMDTENILLAYILNIILNELQRATSNLQENGLYIYDMIKEIYKLNLTINKLNEEIHSMVDDALDFLSEVSNKIMSDPDIPDEYKIENECLNISNVTTAIKTFLTNLKDELHTRFFEEVTQNEDFFLELKYLSPTYFNSQQFNHASLKNLCIFANIDHDLALEQLKGIANIFINYVSINMAEDAKEKDLNCWNEICKFLLMKNQLGDYIEIINLYRFVLTLPTTEIKCERDFSHLKNIKTSKRTNMGNEYLENEMLIYFNRDVMNDVNLEEIINKLSNSSRKMKALLQNLDI